MDDLMVDCPECGGVGRSWYDRPCVSPMGGGHIEEVEMTCRFCDGDKQVDSERAEYYDH
jgi:hypothetical protein